MKNVVLSDILPDNALAEIEKKFNKGKLTRKALLSILEKHRVYMEARGALPEYIVYALAYQLKLPD